MKKKIPTIPAGDIGGNINCNDYRKYFLNRMREIGIKQAVQCPEHLSQTFFASIPDLAAFEVHGCLRKTGFTYTCTLQNAYGMIITVAPGEWIVQLNTGALVRVTPAEYAYVTNQKPE